MEIEITGKKDNLILERTEVEFTIKHDRERTPSRKDVKGKLVEVLGTKKEIVVVNSFHTQFGKGESRGSANVYKSLERAREIEEKYILKRNGLLEEKKKEEGK